jgi:hypothetical protein
MLRDLPFDGMWRYSKWRAFGCSAHCGFVKQSVSHPAKAIVGIADEADLTLRRSDHPKGFVVPFGGISPEVHLIPLSLVSRYVHWLLIYGDETIKNKGGTCLNSIAGIPLP